MSSILEATAIGDDPSGDEVCFPFRHGTLRSSAGTVERVRTEFEQLAKEWIEAVGFLSSISQAIQHPAHLRIIGLGPPAVPILLSELAREPDHWFVALEAITGHDPVKQESQGNLSRMAEDWLSWARENGDRDVASRSVSQPSGA